MQKTKARTYDFSFFDKDGGTALMISAQLGFYDCVVELMNNGADIRLRMQVKYH